MRTARRANLRTFATKSAELFVAKRHILRRKAAHFSSQSRDTLRRKARRFASQSSALCVAKSVGCASKPLAVRQPCPTLRQVKRRKKAKEKPALNWSGSMSPPIMYGVRVTASQHHEHADQCSHEHVDHPRQAGLLADSARRRDQGDTWRHRRVMIHLDSLGILCLPLLLVV